MTSADLVFLYFVQISILETKKCAKCRILNMFGSGIISPVKCHSEIFQQLNPAY